MIRICYDQMNRMHRRDQSEIFKKELKCLAQQMDSRNLEIKAVGFFSINRTMAGFIMTSLSTYLIVFVQMIYSDKDDEKYAND